MKTSLAHLPRRNQEALRHAVELIRGSLPETEAVILFGSYARGTFVDMDWREDFGTPTVFRSDYDLVVLTAPGTDSHYTRNRLDKAQAHFMRLRPSEPTMQIVDMKISTFNRMVSEARYFYTDVKREGILLFYGGRHKFSRIRKLNFEEIGRMAREYFDDKFDRALGFLDNARYDYEKGRFQLSAFHLHQTCENLYHTTSLVFTLYKEREHNLVKLANATRKHAPEEFARVFPQRTERDKRLFDLLLRAYIEGRYNPKFEVTREDLEGLFPKVERLRNVVKRVCRRQFTVYDERLKAKTGGKAAKKTPRVRPAASTRKAHR